MYNRCGVVGILSVRTLDRQKNDKKRTFDACAVDVYVMSCTLHVLVAKMVCLCRSHH